MLMGGPPPEAHQLRRLWELCDLRKPAPKPERSLRLNPGPSQ